MTNRAGLKVAVIVNDMSEINIDAALVKKGDASLNRVEEKLVEMQNGCICCTLREDLLIEVRRLALARKYDYLLIESTGISEPMQVAETFTFEDENGRSLANYARLDTMVTMVDAHNLLRDFRSVDKLTDRGESVGPEDERTIVDLLTEQIGTSSPLFCFRPKRCAVISQWWRLTHTMALHKCRVCRCDHRQQDGPGERGGGQHGAGSPAEAQPLGQGGQDHLRQAQALSVPRHPQLALVQLREGRSRARLAADHPRRGKETHRLDSRDPNCF